MIRPYYDLILKFDNICFKVWSPQVYTSNEVEWTEELIVKLVDGHNDSSKNTAVQLCPSRCCLAAMVVMGYTTASHCVWSI
jgi:hypothetical protein